MQLVIVPLIWFLDQWTKKYAREVFKDEKRRYYFQQKVSLSYLENEGAFLGFLKNRKMLLHGVTILFIVLIILLAIPYWFMGKGKLSGVGLALLLSGALGNYADRVKDGYVTDFIAFGPRHKVHFNIADFAIFGGALLTILGELLPK